MKTTMKRRKTKKKPPNEYEETNKYFDLLFRCLPHFHYAPLLFHFAVNNLHIVISFDKFLTAVLLDSILA